MERWVGTSGYSYKEWKGSFYPSDLAASKMLAYYAERLNAVEINATFYRLPKAEVIEQWASQVPDGFRFVIKASRRITHMKRLKDATDETVYLLETIAGLGDKLGAVLFQLPPNLKADRERLAAFLDVLPAGTPAVFEFRHDSWGSDEILGLLREHGAARCVADTDAGDPPPIVATADIGYFRLRREEYTDAQLRAWSEAISAQPWSEAFVFFKHEDDGAGPAMAARLNALT